ncbi:uncharacterized protein [Aegilops tauschii subsp. strangulata]|uniref:uncharacterized protein n=1 Tax=Aegilops tauschii subsp. strangulata TaxID=200361 RepID=UPI001E1CAB53|nr:uncharacterized protein LOC120964491 [Aegilops tauschii subsp. strangulata]
MEAARVFLPLPRRPPVLLPLPPRAPLLLAARLPPRAMSDQEHEEVVRWLARVYGWLKKGKKLAKGMTRLTASSPSRMKKRLLACPAPSFPDLRDLIERLARRADAVTLAALLGAALLLYIITRSGADADEEEEEGIVLTARLPPSARRHLVLMTLPLVPRGPGARRPPWAWSLCFHGHAAAAVHPQVRMWDSCGCGFLPYCLRFLLLILFSWQRLIFPGCHDRTEQRRFLAGSHGGTQQRPIFAGSHGGTLQRLILAGSLGRTAPSSAYAHLLHSPTDNAAA